jgi:hypothetical protein
MKKEKFVESLSHAIAQMEGFYKPHTISAKNNNPGNLRSWGKRPIVNGFASFDTEEEGFAALRDQINLNINRGLSLYEFFAGKPKVYPGYSPQKDGNDPLSYALFAARVTKIPDIYVPIKDFLSFSLDDLFPDKKLKLLSTVPAYPGDPNPLHLYSFDNCLALADELEVEVYTLTRKIKR